MLCRLCLHSSTSMMCSPSKHRDTMMAGRFNPRIIKKEFHLATFQEVPPGNVIYCNMMYFIWLAGKSMSFHGTIWKGSSSGFSFPGRIKSLGGLRGLKIWQTPIWEHRNIETFQVSPPSWSSWFMFNHPTKTKPISEICYKLYIHPTYLTYGASPGSNHPTAIAP